MPRAPGTGRTSLHGPRGSRDALAAPRFYLPALHGTLWSVRDASYIEPLPRVGAIPRHTATERKMPRTETRLRPSACMANPFVPTQHKQPVKPTQSLRPVSDPAAHGGVCWLVLRLVHGLLLGCLRLTATLGGEWPPLAIHAPREPLTPRRHTDHHVPANRRTTLRTILTYGGHTKSSDRAKPPWKALCTLAA